MKYPELQAHFPVDATNIIFGSLHVAQIPVSFPELVQVLQEESHATHVSPDFNVK
jgi:hypothetical protein